MSYVKHERRPPSWWRGQYEVVSQMRDAGWVVFSQCRTCKVRIKLDLDLTIRVHGPEVSLWCHHQKCPVLGCWDGVVTFHAQPPELFQPFELEAPWPPNREPGWWREAAAWKARKEELRRADVARYREAKKSRKPGA